MMYWEIIEQTVNIIEAILVVYFLQGFLDIKEEKNHKTVVIFGFAVYYIMVVIMNALVAFEGTGLLVYMAVLFVYLTVFFKSSLWLNALASTLIMEGIQIVNICTSLLVSKAANVTVESLIMEQNGLRLLTLILTKVFLLCLIRMLLRIKRQYYLRQTEWIGILFTLIITILIINLFFEVLMSNQLGPFYEQRVYLGIIGSVSINIVIFYLFRRIGEEHETSMKYKMLKMDYKTRSDHLSELQHLYERISRIKHDVKHMVSIIRAMIADGDLESIDNLLQEQLENKVDAINPIIGVDDTFLGTFLGEKKTLCKEEGIDLKIFVQQDIYFDEMIDLLILLGNLIDNAIDACRKVEDKKISLSIVSVSGFIRILVKNTCEESVLKENPDLKTSKEDKEIHGFGVLSIRDIVDRYEGICEYYEENSMFCCVVVLPVEL